MPGEKTPELSKFREAAEACRGNITKIARVFSVHRNTVYNWMQSNEEFRTCINDFKMQLYDQALEAAKALVVGIPRIEQGVLVGWIERPDPNMIRYILSTLGKNEGFTERKEVTGDGAPLFPKVINLVVDPDEDSEHLINSNPDEDIDGIEVKI